MTRAYLQEVLFEQFARVGKSLASAKRMDLLDVLSQGERTVAALAQATGLKLTTASAHLQTLRHGGLVASRRDGARIYYRLAGEDVARLCACVRDVARLHPAQTGHAARDFLGDDELEAVGRDDLRERLRSGTVEGRPTVAQSWARRP